MQPHSLYLHIPFCRHRCGYCDFNTYAGLEHLRSAYSRALAQEVRGFGAAPGAPIPLHTIYFGGGTPSLLALDDLKTIFDAIRDSFRLLDGAEITLEANPGTVDQAYFEGLLQLGVNRISMGVQSARQEELLILERQHGYPEAVAAMKAARVAGIENISVDLIFGLPYQELEHWQFNVEQALLLEPEHISLYALTIEHGTPLEKQVLAGQLPLPDEDVAADMYEWTMERLNPAGFTHYEISNWARGVQGGELLSSRHNLQYWRNLPYIGVGAGAHGFLAGTRTQNVLAPMAYIERLDEPNTRAYPQTPATVNARRIDKPTEMGETMMMGLRLIEEGVNARGFAQRFGEELTTTYADEILELSEVGLLEWFGDDLRLTERGRLLGNQVFMRFV